MVTDGRIGLSSAAHVARRAILNFGRHAHLAAALVAPLSTLLDIPALSQPWYSFNGETLPDPYQSLVLSGVSLALSVVANGLLVLRFSVSVSEAWKWSTRASLAGWVLKTAIAVSNLIVFGALTRNGPGYEYIEGFWCAVVSCIAAGLVSLLLVIHYLVRERRRIRHLKRHSGAPGDEAIEPDCFDPEEVENGNGNEESPPRRGGDSIATHLLDVFASIRRRQASQIQQVHGKETVREVRLRQRGRSFILSELLLFGVIALEALAMSRLEGWTYFDGIYFSFTSMLLIGFGDLHPTKTWSKILLFPFTVITVGLLTNQVTMIVAALRDEREKRRDKWKAAYEAKWDERLAHEEPDATEKDDRPSSANESDSEKLKETSIGASSSHSNDGLSRQRSRRSITGRRHKGENPDAKTNQLVREMTRLHELHVAEEKLLHMYDFGLSLVLLLVFWLIGAVVFSVEEDWSYGNAVYFTYVLFLTLGFGDYYPTTAAAKVTTIVYGLLAIPIISFFVLQTFNQVVSSISRLQRDQKHQHELDRKRSEGLFTHGELVAKLRADIVSRLPDYLSDGSKGTAKKGKRKSKIPEEIAARLRRHETRQLLLDAALGTACIFEAQSRCLLLEHLEPGSAASNLLRADIAVQQKELEVLEADRQIWQQAHAAAKEDTDDLSQIRKYRAAFAQLVVIASELRAVVDEERAEDEKLREAIEEADSEDDSEDSSDEPSAGGEASAMPSKENEKKQ